MNNVSMDQPSWLKKSSVFLIFLIVESMVFAIITLSSYLPQTTLLGYHAGLTVTLLIMALFLRRSEKGKTYWPVIYVFFVAGAAVLTSSLFSDDLLGFFGHRITTPQGIALVQLRDRYSGKWYSKGYAKTDICTISD